MRFEKRLRDGIHDGTITVAFRRWKRRQVVPGGRYRTGMGGMAEVDTVAVIEPGDISPQDAARAGYPSVAAAVADLRGDPGLPVFRIALHALAGEDPRSALAADAGLSADDVARIGQRLTRLDRASAHGPWTAVTLAAIAAQPDVVATELAAEQGLPRDVFKRNVRSLKGLGLTLSQPVGYRLSPRGRAYLDAVTLAHG